MTASTTIRRVAVALWIGLIGGTAMAQTSAAVPQVRSDGVSEEARRHLLRGMAAVEIAKSSDDLMIAVDEFQRATEIAPRLAMAWFNLGKAQGLLGRYADAIASYRQYLVVAPGADDAQRVRDEIIKLEFRQELAAREKGRAGTWVSHDGALYQLTLDANRMTLKTNSRPVHEDEVVSTYSLVGSVPITIFSQAEYQLVLRGNRFAGTWHRSPIPADKCMVPPDTADVEGELKDRENKMLLRHERSTFKASTQMSLLGDDACAGVANVGRKPVEVVLFGPLGKGGVATEITGLTQWWDGGLSAIQFGWQGRMGVRVKEGSPAYAAGLRDEDEFLSIDGVPVKGLSAGEAMFRLHGPLGSPVKLDIRRQGSAEILSIIFTRI